MLDERGIALEQLRRLDGVWAGLGAALRRSSVASASRSSSSLWNLQVLQRDELVARGDEGLWRSSARPIRTPSALDPRTRSGEPGEAAVARHDAEPANRPEKSRSIALITMAVSVASGPCVKANCCIGRD